jgi:tRNA A-37 threonylcarbamoyl transferase component Bud32
MDFKTNTCKKEITDEEVNASVLPKIENDEGLVFTDEKEEIKTDAEVFAENHAWLKLERILLPKQDIEHLCDSDEESSIVEAVKELGFTDEGREGLVFTDEATEGLVFTDVDDDDTDYDEGDEEYDEDDEIDELLEETMFSLQNEYYFLRRIVCHGFVSLYKAIDRKTKQYVCVKIVVRHGISSRNVDRLPIEARILTCIKNGDDEHHGKQYLQMPLAFFSSPSSFVIVSKLYKESSFRRSLFGNNEDIVIMMRQLLKAVEYIHSIGIISRDIKNSNLLWDKTEKKLILCDFDLSTFITDKGHSVTLGTDGYIAPEVLLHDNDTMNKSRYSKEIDIYSAGVVFGSLLYNVC